MLMKPQLEFNQHMNARSFTNPDRIFTNLCILQDVVYQHHSPPRIQ